MLKKMYSEDELTRLSKMLLIISRFTDDHSQKIYNIIHQTAVVFNVTENAIIHDKSRGEVNDARHVCYFLIKKETGMSLDSISEIFQRRTTVSNISVHIKRIRLLDPNSKHDSILLKKVNEVTNLINKKHGMA